MADRVQKIVTRLPGPAGVTGVWKTAERGPVRGDAGSAAGPGAVPAGAYGFEAAPIRQYRSVSGHLLRLPATTRGTVPHALRRVTSPQVTGRCAAYTT